MKWVHPLDLVGATGDSKATRAEHPMRHLSADDYDRGWRQIPDGPFGTILVAASVLAVIVSMVLL